MQLASLPHIALYQNIVDNITAPREKPSNAKLVVRLRELSDRSQIKKTGITDEPSTALATERLSKFCGYL